MFNKNNFCHIASNNRNEKKAGVFVYKTTDSLETVATSGYFNDKIVDINLHDLIIHEWHNPADRTDVQHNLLCVVERTLDNVGTIIIKSKWEEDIEQIIEGLGNNFVKIDGSSIMTGPLKFKAGSMRGAIAPYLNGVSFWKMDSQENITNIANLTDSQFLPVTTNSIDLGNTTHIWKDAHVARVITSVLNNGYDIAVPMTNNADTLALKSEVDLAANSGSQLYTTGVWYAKMYSASTVPTGAEYDGRNYADFSQVDNDNNPIIVIYEGQSGAWVEIDRITPPAEYNGYVTITSKIWDIAEQTDQQGGEVLWSYNKKTFTPYPKIVSLLNQANTDLSNLTSAGKNISNWSSNVTNCITEIPQDIKLELNNGTLTLKAGSKVYVPNGAGVFDEVVISNDINMNTGFVAFVAVFYKNDGTLYSLPLGRIFSGPSQPTNPAITSLWYDTTNNVIKRTTDTGSTWTNYGLSLPIAIVDLTSGTISSIDQVFNGLGYIGSTVFALPGVKGLIPNGRNADGTLKNTAFEISSVKTITSGVTANYTVALNSSGILLDSVASYSEQENYNGGYSRNYAFVGSLTNTSGVISNFNIKTTFHAVDYSDTECMTIGALSNIVNGADTKVGDVYCTSAGDNISVYAPSGGKWLVLYVAEVNISTASLYLFSDDLYNRPGKVVNGGTQITQARSGYGAYVSLLKIS